MEFEHELIIPNIGFNFKIFQFEGKDGNYIREKHWHRSIEIFAVFDGELTFVVNEDEYPLKAGEFFLMNSNEIHSIISPRPNYTIVLQIPLPVFEKYYTNEQYIYFSHSPRKQDEQVMECIKNMYHQIGEKRLGYELKVQSEFYSILYLMVGKYRRADVSEEELKSYQKLNRLSAITAYIREHYQGELSLEKVSEEFGYSPEYLSRMFRKYAKTNYKTYLQSIRVEYAYQELANTEHTISEIAMNHGFPNSGAFSREFQKKYHVLPSEYRKKRELF